MYLTCLCRTATRRAEELCGHAIHGIQELAQKRAPLFPAYEYSTSQQRPATAFTCFDGLRTPKKQTTFWLLRRPDHKQRDSDLSISLTALHSSALVSTNSWVGFAHQFYTKTACTPSSSVNV